MKFRALARIKAEQTQLLTKPFNEDNSTLSRSYRIFALCNSSRHHQPAANRCYNSRPSRLNCVVVQQLEKVLFRPVFIRMISFVLDVHVMLAVIYRNHLLAILSSCRLSGRGACSRLLSVWRVWVATISHKHILWRTLEGDERMCVRVFAKKMGFRERRAVRGYREREDVAVARMHLWQVCEKLQFPNGIRLKFNWNSRIWETSNNMYQAAAVLVASVF